MTEPIEGAYKLSLPSFEGPLDLLLHLCQKHELDILDIPIGFVTEKYLEFLSVMQLLNLDVASEYLVMAATLAHIKSKMLLPAPPPGQEDDALNEEEDPREALIRRLLEYQKYKQAGEDLAGRGIAGRDVFLRGAPVAEAVHTGLPPLAGVPIYSLVEAFQGVLSRSKVKLTHEIVHERMSLTDRINELVDILRVRRRLVFEELFENLETSFNLVITFLALLEMTRLRMTRLTQVEPLAPIYVEFTASSEASADAGAGLSDGSAQGDVSPTDAPPGFTEAAVETEPPPPEEGAAQADGGEAPEADGIDTSDPAPTDAPPPPEPSDAPDGDDATGGPYETVPPSREETIAPPPSQSWPPPPEEGSPEPEVTDLDAAPPSDPAMLADHGEPADDSPAGAENDDR